MDGACGVERRLDCTASSPLQERSGAAAVAAAEETRRGENSHPDARKRAQPLCLAAPTASALEDCGNKPHPFFYSATCFKHLQIFAQVRRTQFTEQVGSTSQSFVL